MLWPGTLIMMAEFFPKAGVVAYALLAAGGDLGGSVAPQLMGVLADMFGLNVGMVVSAIFPLLGILLLLFLQKKKIK
jgi:MFS family permease